MCVCVCVHAKVSFRSFRILYVKSVYLEWNIVKTWT